MFRTWTRSPRGWLRRVALVLADNILVPGAPEYRATMREREGKTSIRGSPGPSRQEPCGPLRGVSWREAMGLRRGALTFTRLLVTGKPPRDLRKKYFDAVKLRAFQPLTPDDEASEAVGWCVMERPFDLDF